MHVVDGESVARIAFAGMAGAGKRANLRALAQLVVPEPLVTPGPTARVDLRLSTPWSGEPLRILAETWPPDHVPAGELPDALVFVADSHPACIDANVAALDALQRTLTQRGRPLDEMPHVVQYNKRDLGVVLAVGELRSVLNRFGGDEIEAVAHRGRGVLTTLVLAVHGFSPRRSYPSFARRLQR